MRMKSFSCWISVLIVLAMPLGAQAQTFTTLVSFDGKDGSEPLAPLVQGINGAFYGTTFFGGANDQGTVFVLNATGATRTLYSFCSQTDCTDGSSPRSGLFLAVDGNFY